MIKTLSLLRRRDDVLPDQFKHHWLDIHVPMSSTVDGLKGYAVSQIEGGLTRPDVAGLAPGLQIDGIAETWTADMAARQAMFHSPQAQAWYADGAKFISSAEIFVTEEKIVVPPPRKNGMHAKMVSFLVRKEGLSKEDFMEKWATGHAALAAAVPGISGFTLSIIHEQFPKADLAPLGFPRVDGIASTWFDSLEVRANLAHAPEAITWRADGAAFIGKMVTFVTKEQVVIWPANRLA